MNNFFTAEVTAINRQEALRYLSYNDTPDEKTSALMDQCERKLLAAVKGKYTFRIYDIISNDREAVELEGCAMKMTGKDICAHLDGCEKAALLCATIGSDADTLIRREQISDMASAVITDSLASCAVEAVCNSAEEHIRRECPDMFMTWRFSPGYGDMPIALQRQFLEAVNAGRYIGVFANENSILTPKKSVTAVIGLSSKPIEKKRRGCAVCRLYKDCEFRKRGSRCTDE